MRRKELDPIGYAFSVNKNNAKRRGKFWNITIEEWRNWEHIDEYILLKGKKLESATIDCIKNELGYRIDNIRILSLLDNSKKGTKDPDDCPF